MPTSRRPSIAIVGGGLSGLATAYELSRQGHSDFVLYEAAPRLGGILETVRPAGSGFVLEGGPDSWVTEKPWARELAIELGLEAEIIPSNDAHRRTYLLNGDKLTAMPEGMRMMVPTDLEAIASSPLFSEAARQAYREEPARAAELKAFAAARRADDDESVSSFVRRHFGEEVAAIIAGPLLAGVFGGDIRQLSVTAVMAPFLKMERDHGSLILALQRQQSSGQSRPSVFTTLKSGLQTFVERMAAALPAFSVRLGEPVLSIAPRDGGWQVTTASAASSFDRVILATPIHHARELIAPWNPDLSALLEIEATSSVIAALAFDREQSAKLRIPEGFGFLVPQQPQAEGENAEPELLACTFVDQKFPNRAPEGCVVLRAFYGDDVAQRLLPEPDDTVLAFTGRRLSRVFGEMPQPAIAFVRRLPRSLPQYAVGHPARVARIEAMVREISGFSLIGNAFHGVGLPDLIRQGRATAREVLSS